MVGEPGTALISGRLLCRDRPLAAGPAGQFRVADLRTVEATCGASSFLLPTLPGDEYPPLPVLPDACGRASMPLCSRRPWLRWQSPRRHRTTATTPRRRYPDGDRTGRASDPSAATDRRLAVRELAWNPLAIEGPLAVTVPGRELLEATKAFADAGEVSVHLGDSETSISLTAKTRQTGLRADGLR